jgi:hypothetical protein
MVCGTGFGDQYASILSAYKAYKDLTKNNFDVEVGILVNNPYFSSDIPLSTIWDFSPFDCEIQHIKHYEIEKLNGYKKIIDGNFHIYTTNSEDELKNFKFYDYGRHGMLYNSDIEFFDTQFVTDEIIKMSEFFLLNRNNIYGIHLRISDDIMHQTYNQIIENGHYGPQLNRVMKYIEENQNTQFMVCSNSRDIKSTFLNRFGNIFCNEFSSDLRLHNVIATHGYDKDKENEYITHAKEIIAEMVCFAKCRNIWSTNTFYSNYVTYGIVHNEFHHNWNAKMFDLIKL